MPLKFIQSASSSGVATPLEKSQQVAEGLHVLQPLAHLMVIALILMMMMVFSGHGVCDGYFLDAIASPST